MPFNIAHRLPDHPPFNTPEDAFRAGYTQVCHHTDGGPCPWRMEPNTYCFTCRMGATHNFTNGWTNYSRKRLTGIHMARRSSRFNRFCQQHP